MTLKFFAKRGRGQGHVTPYIFWSLKTHSSRMTKVTDLKFGTHAHGDSSNMTTENVFKRGNCHGQVSFWELTAKGMNPEFGMHAPRNRPDICP